MQCTRSGRLPRSLARGTAHFGDCGLTVGADGDGGHGNAIGRVQGLLAEHGHYRIARLQPTPRVRTLPSAGKPTP